MTKKLFLKYFIPPAIIDLAKCILGKNQRNYVKKYLKNGSVPWSSSYNIYQAHFIANSLTNKDLLKIFRSGESLPPNYGFSVDERCVEYPWFFANLSYSAKNILDAGSTLNYEYILNQPIFKNSNLHIMTFAPEGHDFCQNGISYIYNDLRNIPIRDDYYDAIACISVLEHIGLDNTIFTNNEAHNENNPEDYILVMKEFRRVLKPGGSLFLSVPYGTYQHYGMFQQFDRKLLSNAEEAFGKNSNLVENFYRYTKKGWQISNSQDCAKCEYVEWIALHWQHNHGKPFPNPIPLEPDSAAAARSVVCVQLIKD